MGVQYILLKLKWFKSEGTLGCLFLIGTPPHRYQAKDLLQPHAHQLKFFKYPKTNSPPCYGYLRVLGSLFPFGEQLIS